MKNPTARTARQGSGWNSSPAVSNQNNATATRIVQENLAASRLVHRFGLPQHVAQTVCEANGLGGAR